jgi:hypothetical protein
MEPTIPITSVVLIFKKLWALCQASNTLANQNKALDAKNKAEDLLAQSVKLLNDMSLTDCLKYDDYEQLDIYIDACAPFRCSLSPAYVCYSGSQKSTRKSSKSMTGGSKVVGSSRRC